MTKPKIKFKLIKLERALVFQVLEQDSRFISPQNSTEHACRFQARNGFKVISNGYPDLPRNAVYVRGAFSHFDLQVCSLKFNSNEERDTHFENVLEALRDWSLNAPQFAEDKAVAPTAEPDTYSF